MNKKNLILLSANVVLVLAIIIQALLRPAPPAKIADWDSKDCDRIVLKNGDSTFTLKKDGDVWRINEEAYLADDAIISGTIERLNQTEVLETVSKSADLKRYGLDEAQAGEISIYSGNKILQTLYVGQQDLSGNFNYVKLPDKGDIYLVSQDLRGLVEYNLHTLREKDIISLDSAQSIEQIIATVGDNYTLAKYAIPNDDDTIAAEQLWKFTDESNSEVDQSKADALASGLRSVRVSTFLDELPATPPIWQTTVVTNTAKISITLYQKNEDGEYPAESTGLEGKFTLMAYEAEGMMKTRSDLTVTADEGAGE